VRFFALLLVALINSAIAAGYYLNIVRYMFLMPAEDESRIKVGPSLGIVLGVTFVAVLGLGILPGQLIQWASESAQFLIQF
jgi:NADH:ubiquinone oxidoreductase subunit 2 (subunit N)